MYVFVNMCLSECMCMCVYMCMYICLYVCICVYVIMRVRACLVLYCVLMCGCPAAALSSV
jgi:hypothetical protein